MNNQQSTKIADLAKQYGRLVFQSAYRILSDSHLAEDVTQEVFLKLFKKPKRAFDRILNWPAYLKTMATSTSFDLIRKRRSPIEESVESKQLEKIQDCTANQPSRKLSDRQNVDSLRQALTQLSAIEAQVFALRYFEEFSYEEIANQLEITNSLVGVSLHRAQKKLAELISRSEISGENHEYTR